MSEAPFECEFCGLPSWVDPSDQSPPPDYCHPRDHGEPEAEEAQRAYRRNDAAAALADVGPVVGLPDFASQIADEALRAITAAQGVLAAGADEAPWQFGHLIGKLTMHPDGDPTDRDTMRMDGAAFAATFAAAHRNGAAMGIRALLKFAGEGE